MQQSFGFNTTHSRYTRSLTSAFGWAELAASANKWVKFMKGAPRVVLFCSIMQKCLQQVGQFGEDTFCRGDTFFEGDTFFGRDTFLGKTHFSEETLFRGRHIFRGRHVFSGDTSFGRDTFFGGRHFFWGRHIFRGGHIF